MLQDRFNQTDSFRREIARRAQSVLDVMLDRSTWEWREREVLANPEILVHGEDCPLCQDGRDNPRCLVCGGSGAVQMW